MRVISNSWGIWNVSILERKTGLGLSKTKTDLIHERIVEQILAFSLNNSS